MSRIFPSLVLLALGSSATANNGIEFGIPCLFSTYAANGLGDFLYNYDIPYPYPAQRSSPDKIAIRVGQDRHSRFVTGLVQFDNRTYGSGVWQYHRHRGRSFEIETHLYNYDDAEATGFDPAYVLDAQGPHTCTIPNCYRDTQAGSATNSFGEYQEVNIQFGSFDLSGYFGDLIQSGVPYYFGTRATTGRGNRSLMKINVQMMQNRALGINSVFNMLRCSNSTDYAALGFDARVYAPVCVVNYSSAGSFEKCAR